MLYTYFWVTPQRPHSDAGESPKSKNTTSQILYTLKLLKLPSYSFLSVSQFNSPVMMVGPKEVLTLVVILAVLLLWPNDPYAQLKMNCKIQHF